MSDSISFETELKRVLWWLFVATKGGATRMKIARFLSENPSNMNRICRDLGLNYRTVEHHIEVMRKNNLVMASGDGYGKVYFLTPSAERGLKEIEKITYRRK
ncbi:MAG TPA: winged helix-turn-helix domain-containing protein [Thermoplasmataceae archaeon]|nr:winged helix-turn-helix domain-containing protein [Thermoplasmataceae archaeon]